MFDLSTIDLIALSIFTISLLVLAYAEYRRDRRPTAAKPGPKKAASMERIEPSAASGSIMKEVEEQEPRLRMADEAPRPADMVKSKRAADDMEQMPASKAEMAPPAPSAAGPRAAPPMAKDVAKPIERKASITYWERMSLKEEYDLTVTLHKPELIIVGPSGSTTKESETVYQLPRAGQVRVVPVCSGCNISPSFRDIKVQEIDSETKADFKVLPLTTGSYDLAVEFQSVSPEGSIKSLGVEKVKVTIQQKPILLNIGAHQLGVGRKVPTLFSMCGTLFGFSSFLLGRFGVNLEQQLLSWSATAGTGFAGAMMILLAILLLARGIKPVMTVKGIILKPR